MQRQLISTWFSVFSQYEDLVSGFRKANPFALMAVGEQTYEVDEATVLTTAETYRDDVQ